MRLSRDELVRKLRELPRRAVVGFSLRCAKRVEPALKLAQVLPDAYSAGIDISAIRRHGPFAAYAYAYAYAAADAAAAAADLGKLLALNLGRPGEPGEPIRWNDPRLGPLWPDGEPLWYVEAQQACRELEEKLANLPDPNAPPLSPVTLARFDNRGLLDDMWEEGKLKEYEGEYVISDGTTIFAHGKHLLSVWEQAQVAVTAAGKQPELLTEYYVMRS